MNKSALGPSSHGWHFGAMMFAVALTVNCAFGRPALAAGAAPTVTEPKLRNAAAQQLVSDSLRAFRNGDRKLGVTLLRRAEKTAPQEGWVHFLLGRASLQSYDAASAERELRQARTNGISDEFVLPSLFDAMIKRHEEKKLLDEFREPASDARGPVPAAILSGRAMAMLSLNRPDDAAVSMDRALLLGRDSGSLLARARIALRQNNPALVTKLTNEAFQRDPKNGHVMLAKLDDLIRSNDDPAALALSEKILQQFPNDIQTRAARIDIFLKNNQDAKAKSEFGILSSRVPQARLLEYYQALFLARAKNYEAAWKIAQALPPSFGLAIPNYIIQLSEMAINSGHLEAGAAILARALAYSPDQIDFRLRLATVRLRQDNPHSTLQLLGPLQNSNNPAALDLVGQAKSRMEDFSGAVTALKEAHQLQPQNGQITFHLVQALNESGDKPAARDLLAKLLSSGRAFEDLEAARRLKKILG